MESDLTLLEHFSFYTGGQHIMEMKYNLNGGLTEWDVIQHGWNTSPYYYVYVKDRFKYILDRNLYMVPMLDCSSHFYNMPLGQ